MGRRPRSDGEFWESAKLNNVNFRQYYIRLLELSCSMFKWVNLPETMDERYLELTLFAYGQALLSFDEDIGYINTKCATSGIFNIYHVPIERRAYAENGYNRLLNDQNSVIVYNNYSRTNSMVDVEMFARRLYDLDRAIDVNAKAQKTPLLISCEESQKLALKNLYMKYDGNEPIIVGDKQVRPDSLKAISTQAPFVADRLYELKTNIWNEALTYLGISNITMEKKERLITDEVERGNAGALASRMGRLNERNKACDMFNRMYGTDIHCIYREADIAQTAMPGAKVEIEGKVGADDE